MRLLAPAFSLFAIGSFAAACGSSTNPPPGGDAGTQGDAGADASDAAVACSGPCPASNVKYLVVIVQENHTFDTYFGGYCTAASGSNPTCNDGPACCEAIPAKDPSGASPIVLDDVANGSRDPSHVSTCEGPEMNGGAMDKYVTGVPGCSDPKNFASADPTLVKPYWDLAKGNALADRYFQPIVGQSSSNDIYLARAAWEFDDNKFAPKGALGVSCGFAPNTAEYTDKTIADLLGDKSVPWSWYSEGYKAMSDAAGNCPPAPTACAVGFTSYPCVFDPGDVPFEYFPSFRDKPAFIKDLATFSSDLAGGTLPAVSFVKAIGYKSEHPGQLDKISDGISFVTQTVNEILASRYGSDVLVLVTWDEGGGFFDHVKPPADNTADQKPYGTRVPLLAIGPFVKKNFVSHVTMEHSSIVKFIEWNWLAQQTGQLATRDANVNNLGSVLDPAKTGVKVPEQ